MAEMLKLWVKQVGEEPKEHTISGSVTVDQLKQELMLTM